MNHQPLKTPSISRKQHIYKDTKPLLNLSHVWKGTTYMRWSHRAEPASGWGCGQTFMTSQMCSVFKHTFYKLWRKPREGRTDFTSSHKGAASTVPVVECVTLYESPHPVLFNLTNLSSLLRLKHNTVKTSSTENKQREINGKQPRCVRPTFCGFSVKVSHARAHSGGPWAGHTHTHARVHAHTRVHGLALQAAIQN